MKILAIVMTICFYSLTADAGSCGYIYDINGDDKTALEEAIYSLQTVAGIQTGNQCR
ncbi:MAG: hypothetical protein GY749_39545 [Desulfobacteraceae bacterium]|nr:hypothetical protein [Desulfobacteraceae bacterium]